MKKLCILILSSCLAGISMLPGCSSDKEELIMPVCDTSGVTYSGTIAPLLSANCYVCHSGATPVAPFRLDSHSAVAIQAANGKLWGALSHSTGFSPMPKNASKLSDCNLAKIRKWLDAGYPNN